MIERKFQRWYIGLNRIQQWFVNISAGIFIVLCALLVTHEPSDRPRQTKIILNCDKCGVDPERTITYNEYMDQKQQAEHAWFHSEKQRIQQEIWDERGRQRWCRNHPRDTNCK